MQQINFRAMGCQMMAAVDSDQPGLKKRLDEVPGWFETWEQRLSRFRPESELSQVNQKGGTQPVSPVLAEVVREAQIARRQSGGLVDPLVLNALEAAGYNRNFTDLAEDAIESPVPTVREGTVPTVREGLSPTEQAEGLDQPPDLKLDFHHRRLTLPTNARIDLGGVAKGWAADRAAHRLGRLVATLVDAGGDVAVSGPRADGSPWPIGVADPLNPDQQIDLVMLWRGGVATSGRDYRRWKKNDAWQHHIIDPRTGRPAMTDILSATVIASSARLAETAAKTTLILGGLDGLRWLEKQPNLAGLVVLEDGTILQSRRWIKYIWR